MQALRGMELDSMGNGEITRRATEIGEIARVFKDHPYVRRALRARLTKYNDAGRTKPDIVGAYLEEINSYPLLIRDETIDEAAELSKDIRAGLVLYRQLGSLEGLSGAQAEVFARLTAAQQILFTANLRWVYELSKRFWYIPGTAIMEVIQEGNIGLTCAIAGYDPQRGTFTTYATKWIEREIKRAIADKSRGIRIPVHKHEEYLTVKKAVDKLYTTLGHEPTDADIEAATGLSIADYHELMRVGGSTPASLNKLIGDGNKELGDFIADERADPSPFDGAFSDQARRDIVDLMDRTTLHLVDRFVIGLHNGLSPEVVGHLSVRVDGKELRYEDVYEEYAKAMEVRGLTFEAIGRILNMNHDKVSRCEARGIRAFKDLLARDARVAA